MLGNDATQHLIQSGDRVRHFVGNGLPQPSRAFDVCQQQRHRSRRQHLGHSQVAFVNFAHASHDPPGCDDYSSAKLLTRLLQTLGVRIGNSADAPAAVESG